MRIVRPLLLPLLALACALVLSTPSLANYLQVNLVSDGFVANTRVDPNLVNPWGLASSPTSPFWIADNGTGVSSLYNATTNTIPSLVVTIPGGSPIGITWNDNPSAFPVGPNTGAVFLFASEEGRIAGWHPSLGTTASVQADVPGASYTGLTMHTQTGNSLLYAADFAQGTVDVFDATVQPTLAGAFLDPNLPAGLSPFNVQVLGNEVYVAYARRDPVTGDEVPGAGLGLVNVFDRTGNLLRCVATGGTLNAPWGLALAPASFGEFAGALLVGNFGDG